MTLEGIPGNIRLLVESIGWKFSAIDGDIMLGDGMECYATKHFNALLDESYVVELLHVTADDLACCDVKVVRKKVERVIYDDRSSKVKPCDGGCIECHLDDLEEVV